MKKILILLVLMTAVNISAQNNIDWLTNHKEAISLAESNKANIFIFAFENSSSDTNRVLVEELFNSKEFIAIQTNFIFLKLDVNTDNYNKRLAAHYSKSKELPVIALIDKKGNPIGQSLTVFNKENIKKFISFLKANLK